MRCNKNIYVPLALLVSVVLVAALAIITYSLFSEPKRIQLTPPSADAKAISFFALGDQGSGDFRQWKVARSMEKEAAATGDLDFVILLGDNFYPFGVDSIRDMQWNWKFENMYSGRKMATIPFYAVLGNHDVEGNGEAQIQYSRKEMGSGRWQMPGHYYSKDFGSDNGHPLLRIVFLDSNQSALQNSFNSHETRRAVSGAHPAEPRSLKSPPAVPATASAKKPPSVPSEPSPATTSAG